MKSSEEIKKGMECCIKDSLDPCSGCPYGNMTDEAWECELNADALAYIEQLEAREWELFDLLSSVWHGKQYYFKQDDGTVYSRQSCQYLTFDQAIDEFAYELTGQYSDTQKLKWRSPKAEPPDVDTFYAVTKFDPEIRIYKKNLIDQHYTTEWLNIRNDILYWMPIPDVLKEDA